MNLSQMFILNFIDWAAHSMGKIARRIVLMAGVYPLDTRVVATTRSEHEDEMLSDTLFRIRPWGNKT